MDVVEGWPSTKIFFPLFHENADRYERIERTRRAARVSRPATDTASRTVDGASVREDRAGGTRRRTAGQVNVLHPTYNIIDGSRQREDALIITPISRTLLDNMAPGVAISPVR